MAYVSVLNVSYTLDPKSCSASEDMSFEITLEVNRELEKDLVWKLVYVGSAKSNDHDQVAAQCARSCTPGCLRCPLARLLWIGYPPAPTLIRQKLRSLMKSPKIEYDLLANAELPCIHVYLFFGSGGSESRLLAMHAY